MVVKKRQQHNQFKPSQHPVTVEYQDGEEEGEGVKEFKGIDVLEGLLKRKNRPSDEKISTLLTSLRSHGAIDFVEAVGVIFNFVFYDLRQELIKTTKTHMLLLKTLLDTKPSQVLFLSCLEATILNAQQQQQQQLLKQLLKYLKYLYDEDLAEEEAVLKWYSLGKKEKEGKKEEKEEEEEEKEKEEEEEKEKEEEEEKEKEEEEEEGEQLNAVKKKAKPFVEWLETAEEESD